LLQPALLSMFLLASPGAQEPFQPLDLDTTRGRVTRSEARVDWARLTNQRMEMANKGLRVIVDGLTVILMVPGVEKPRHAKPILLGRGEHQLLFKSIVGMGFNRIVVRNPVNRKEWSARLEQGKAILE